MIKAEIIAHSLSPQGDELISVLCTFPRIILAEVNTHRMLSKNTSSSRAIPFKKMVEAVQNNPFIPIAWQKHHSGMQGNEYLIDVKDIADTQSVWLSARDEAIVQAEMLSENEGITKQLCNRLLEPFMWTTMLITGPRSGWNNFFNLRCPQYHIDSNKFFYKSKKEVIAKFSNQFKALKDKSDLNWLQVNKGQAEIHIMDLAEKIYDALNESTPKKLKEGEWHIPFGNVIEFQLAKWNFIPKEADDLFAVKVSTAMAARTSYTVVGEEKDIDYKKMIELHDRLLTQDPPHSSPLEHCARAMTDIEYATSIKGLGTAQLGTDSIYFEKESKGWCNNFKGFIPYRYLIDNKLKM